MPQLYKTTTGQMFHAGLIAIVPVGLPARGKTFMSQKLARYFRWLGVKTMVFNVGAYRRAKMGANIPHNFFDPSNERNRKRRLEIADEVLDTMVEFLVSGRGQVGIYDTTTTISPERRQHVLERLTSRGIETIFIETIVEDESIIESNIRAVKLNMPDYIGWDPDDAVKDFFQRIEHHRDVYKEISDPELSYVRVLNIGLEGVKIFANRVQGYLQTRIVYYLMNLHMSPRIIYFAKNGISAAEHNLRDDPPLSSKGDQFARNLAAFMSNLRHSGNRADGRPMNALRIWTSVRKRSWQTARYFDSSEYQVEPKRELAELNPGVTEGLSAAEVRACMPEDAERYERDPYHYRFPRAESYHDLALRLEPFIMDLEREVQDILIISHESVLRCLYAYYFNLDEDEIPSVSIPDNVVIQIIPKPYGSAEKQHVIPHCT